MDNIYKDAQYAKIREELNLRLKSLQDQYDVTSREFKKAPKERIDKAYENLDRLAGKRE